MWKLKLLLNQIQIWQWYHWLWTKILYNFIGIIIIISAKRTFIMVFSCSKIVTASRRSHYWRVICKYIFKLLFNTFFFVKNLIYDRSWDPSIQTIVILWSSNLDLLQGLSTDPKMIIRMIGWLRLNNCLNLVRCWLTEVDTHSKRINILKLFLL